jgi:hypothetical protein
LAATLAPHASAGESASKPNERGNLLLDGEMEIASGFQRFRASTLAMTLVKHLHQFIVLFILHPKPIFLLREFLPMTSS